MNSANIFQTVRLSEDEYSWSVVSRFHEFLSLAESYYGPRDKSFTICGIELVDGDKPQVWFPGGYGKKNIIIQLTKNCFNDPELAIYQLAHETIHCLNPVPPEKTTVLEEGLAVYFSQLMLTEQKYPVRNIVGGNYKLAHGIVRRLMAKFENFVIDMRKDGTGAISEITMDDYKKSEYSDKVPNIVKMLSTFDYTNGGRVA